MTEPEGINYIDSALMQKMCHPIAVDLFDSFTEPMTKFDDHERALLESALGNPQQKYYPTFVKKAAILYYGLIKNHPFKNGNKRMATATLLTFLFINNLWLKEDDRKIEDYLVTLAKRVANSKGSEKKSEFLFEIELWLVQNIVSSEAIK